MHADLHVYL